MKHFILTIFSLTIISSVSYAEDCTQPEITATTGGTYCSGDVEVTLEITGTLGNATEWQWYTGSCGGDVILTGENATSITVDIGEADSYFVRGIGVGDDNCVGTTAECTEIKVVLDNEPPVVECLENIVTNSETGLCEATVTYEEPMATDNCDGEITVEMTNGLGSGASFPVGETTETYVFTDANGNESTCSFTVTVNDTEPPEIANCPDDIVVDNDDRECSTVVTYDMPTATDNCEGDITVDDSGALGSGASFPVGVTTETYVFTDANGNEASCSFMITVEDTEPPVITLSKTKTSKWPPNHKHFEIKIKDYIESVSDNCPGVTVDNIIIDGASSDEAQNDKGDGNTEDDIMISDDCRTIHLLAERAGGGNGRVYTVNLAVMDAHGNIGVAEIKAEIGHDNGKKKSVIDDGPVYIVNGCDLEEDEDASIQPVEEAEGISYDEVGDDQLETYPNPVNSSFVIDYIPEFNDHVSIDLYNLSGKKIRHLFEGDLLKDKQYSWTYNIDRINDRVFLLLIQGQKTHRLRKILKE